MPLTDQAKISFGREPFNGYSHLLGAAAAIVGGVILLRQAQGNPLLLVACAIYSASLFLAFFSSALFHLVGGPQDLTRRLRDFDHHCIRGLIVGTYAPLAVIMLPAGWALSALVFMVAVLASNAVVMSRKREEISRSKLAAWYSGIATLSLLAVPFCWADFWQPILWTSFGSLFYIAGAVCYVKKVPRRAKWLNFHEVWHICVMIGAFVHYQVILRLV
jgi:hemolysin III